MGRGWAGCGPQSCGLASARCARAVAQDKIAAASRACALMTAPEGYGGDVQPQTLASSLRARSIEGLTCKGNLLHSLAASAR